VKNRRDFLKTSVLGIVGAKMIACSGGDGPQGGDTQAGQKAEKTVANLQAAHNGESNASAKYAAFAKKADEEGYKTVASLFRAASEAERVHVENHAKVIRQLGAEPKADIKTPEVKSTAENLQTAIDGEDYEWKKMYPEFIAQAKVDEQDDAVRTMDWAMRAEVEHAKLYRQALDNLEAWKEGGKKFLVCANCGFTTDDLSLDRCPSCAVGRDRMNEVA
jgi:rubrerythrin